MSASESTSSPETFPAHFALYILGGLCVGAGLMTLYWSFGFTGGDLNAHAALVGFSGLDNISPLDPSDYSIPLVVVGVSCLVYANAIAWRYTGGY